MSKQREALELALKTLEQHGTPKLNHEDVYGACIASIREALAEQEPWTPDDMAYRPGGLSMSAEQEPVAWMMVNEEHGHKPTLHWKPQEDWHITWKAVPLYTAPPARKPLMDEQISAIVQSMSAYTWDAHMLARAIERAHEITQPNEENT